MSDSKRARLFLKLLRTKDTLKLKFNQIMTKFRSRIGIQMRTLEEEITKNIIRNKASCLQGKKVKIKGRSLIKLKTRES